ncbi:MAG: aminotransferase class V-fold PLP-dependent enzyme [bacterium]
MQKKTQMSPVFLRKETIGVNALIKTPFGELPMTYCDYTASGRCLAFIEAYVLKLQQMYANTHTEDDYSGRCMTALMHEAETRIKQSLNAGPDGRLIAVGTGATGAISRLQQMLGVYLPPATRLMLDALVHKSDLAQLEREKLYKSIDNDRPVVFVGPYEHHSNEVSWREGLVEVVEVELDAQGHIDLPHLESLLQDPQYQNRLRIGAFSAASNVTGLISEVPEIARLLHRYNALACFDYAASAPYVEIDMNPPDHAARIDAVFISPHKFIGGPGSSGILVFRDCLYHRELGPTHGGGGTVDYVGRSRHDFIADIEERERPGTPGVMQVIRAALAFEVKSEIGVAQIECIEQTYLKQSFDAWGQCERIQILGDPDPEHRVGIISFNIKDAWGGVLHPRLVTVLLNDLFGIQSRAGCSCAGPYGHRLLGIDEKQSEKYRQAVKLGYHGVKPGWCRIGWHYTMDEHEVEYVIQAVLFLAENGSKFLSEYKFDMNSAEWVHKKGLPEISGICLLTAASARLEGLSLETMPTEQRIAWYKDQMQQVKQLSASMLLPGQQELAVFPAEIKELKFFSFVD